MAYSGNGLLGNLKGRISNMVVYEMLGKLVIRSKPSGKVPPAVGAKKKSQEEFAFVLRVLQAVKTFIRLGFYDTATTRIPFQEAMSVNLPRMRQHEDKPSLLWFLASSGDRSGAVNPEWYRLSDQAIVKWGEYVPGKVWDKQDIVLLMAINTTTLETTFSADYCRHEQQAQINLPKTLENEKIQVFIAFKNYESQKKNPLNISESQVVPEVIVE